MFVCFLIECFTIPSTDMLCDFGGIHLNALFLHFPICKIGLIHLTHISFVQSFEALRLKVLCKSKMSLGQNLPQQDNTYLMGQQCLRDSSDRVSSAFFHQRSGACLSCKRMKGIVPQTSLWLIWDPHTALCHL